MAEGPEAHRWIAERMSHIEISGIRKMFELTRSLKDPINLSIGQPHFDVPDPVKAAAHAAIDAGHNGYTVSAGLPELRAMIRTEVQQRYPHADREVLLTSGTSGGLVLALLATVNPGDEVIVFDPYFVGYPHMITLAGGRMVPLDTYPDFDIDPDRVKAALTTRTKLILVNSPANPTGKVLSRDRLRDLAGLAQKHGILLLSDEIYRLFTYEGVFASPAEFNDSVLVVDGFSKSHAMTGWRLGYAHGPRRLIEEMIKLQQFTFVCPPSMVQHAGLVAQKVDMSDRVTEYRRKRDRVWEGLKERYDLVKPEGAFYAFPRAPRASSTEFVTEALAQNLLIVPGKVFGSRDSHFRISYAADDRTLEKGIEVLNRLAS